MNERERRLKRNKLWYRVWSTAMGAGLLMVLAGIILVFILPALGASLLTYGILICVIAASFYFITRTRYTKSRLAYDAYLRAERKIRGDDAGEP